jgi:competence protein ComEA
MVDPVESLTLRLERPAPRLSFSDRCRERRDRALDELRGRLSLVTIGRVVTVAGSVLVVVAAGLWLLRAPAQPVEVSIPRPTATAVQSSVPVVSHVAGGPASGREIVVQIAGAVARPGVYRLADGSRVIDLVTTAGGAIDGVDASTLALAQKLTDGQRVYVARPGETVVPVAADPGAGPQQTGPVNLNTATVAQLEALPGVGPATATAIVTYREKHGPFRAVTGLLEVPGIGDAKLDALRDLVTV